MKIFIAGSTGQLGSSITQKLAVTNHEVIALHRPGSDTNALRQLPGVILVQGDLLDPTTLKPALQGVDVVISTSNAAVPTQKADNFKNDVLGHRNLIREAKEAGVQQFIFTSAIAFGRYDQKIPLCRSKRQTEADLSASGIPYTIFQPANFMDIYFAFFGTELPLRGTAVSSLNRPFPFMNSFYAGVRKNMEEKSLFAVVGKGDQPVSFISIDNAADFFIRAIGNPKAMNRIIPIGGPEALSALQVKSVFEEAYGKPLKVKSTPAGVIGVMAKIMSPFNINASNILAMQYVGSKTPAVIPQAKEVAVEFGIQLTSAAEYVRSKESVLVN